MENKPRYVFFGSPEFAAIILQKLIDAGLPPLTVICNPDRPVGRKKIITPPPAKLIAKKNNIPVWQPEKLDAEFKSKLANPKLDFTVIAAYSQILKKDVLSIARLGAIGVHPSLLPKYRGATPIQNAILNGETESGITLFLVDEKVDHGPILSASKQSLAEKENYQALHDKLAELGAKLLIQTIPDFFTGKIKPQPQDESKATLTEKFTTQDGYVNLQKDNPVMVERKIRALNPEPGVWTIYNSKRTKLLEAEITVGQIKLKKIQEAGKNPKTL